MPRLSTNPLCQICGDPVEAKSLCKKHYMRFRRHGHTELTRPADWGSREKHPLYHSWSWMPRSGGRVPEWDDFWKFVADVGKRPSEVHKLIRNDPSKPFGPQNCYWREGTPAADKAAWMRKYRADNPAKVKGYELKKRFGISVQKYDEMMDAQGGVCAICGNSETMIDKRGLKMSLAVDHCHKTGKVRGLLCKNCNHGLGNFKDDQGLLRKALDYLGKGKTNT